VSQKVKIDSSFISVALNYFENSTNDNFVDLVQHQAAIDIYENASLFESDFEKIDDFWQKILQKEKEKGDKYFENIFEAQNYFTRNKNDFTQAFNEMRFFIPRDTDIECKLYLMFGYDLGIANERNALINLGHPLYHKHHRELLYFSMHELYHVVYFNYHPLSTVSEIKTISDLLSLIKHLTHLEGLATYLTLEKRIMENSLTFKDYKVLTSEKETNKLTKEYFKIFKKIAKQSERHVTEEDFNLLGNFSGGSRLWYITGGQMAKMIDENLGREALVQTIIDGPESFFKQYNSIQK